jgi:hypothetical protein
MNGAGSSVSRAASNRELKAISVIRTVDSGPLIQAAVVRGARDERTGARAGDCDE